MLNTQFGEIGVEEENEVLREAVVDWLRDAWTGTYMASLKHEPILALLTPDCRTHVAIYSPVSYESF